MDYPFELVGKIGSMALIRKEDQEIDYNIISRLGADLKPGMIWVTSGATEIGRLDYIKRTGRELNGDPEQDKTDYSSQGQAILMQNYRQFIRPEYGVRQILVEHTHFNDPEKREHIRQLLIRAENRKMELAARRKMGGEVYECVDNDETAAVIAGLVKARMLVLMTSTEGIYREVGNPDSLVRDVTGKSFEEVEKKVRELQNSCVGASRAGANGARAKLEYALRCVRGGTTVVIGHARHHLSELAEGRVPARESEYCHDVTGWDTVFYPGDGDPQRGFRRLRRGGTD